MSSNTKHIYPNVTPQSYATKVTTGVTAVMSNMERDTAQLLKSPSVLTIPVEQVASVQREIRNDIAHVEKAMQVISDHSQTDAGLTQIKSTFNEHKKALQAIDSTLAQPDKKPEKEQDKKQHKREIDARDRYTSFNRICAQCKEYSLKADQTSNVFKKVGYTIAKSATLLFRSIFSQVAEYSTSPIPRSPSKPTDRSNEVAMLHADAINNAAIKRRAQQVHVQCAEEISETPVLSKLNLNVESVKKLSKQVANDKDLQKVLNQCQTLPKSTTMCYSAENWLEKKKDILHEFSLLTSNMDPNKMMQNKKSMEKILDYTAMKIAEINQDHKTNYIERAILQQKVLEKSLEYIERSSMPQNMRKALGSHLRDKFEVAEVGHIRAAVGAKSTVLDGIISHQAKELLRNNKEQSRGKPKGQTRW